MRRLRLTGRLTAALMGVTLLALASAAAMYVAIAGNIFDELVLAEHTEHFSSDVVAYYQAHGNFDGFGPALGDQISGAAPGAGLGFSAKPAEPKPEGRPPAGGPAAKPPPRQDEPQSGTGAPVKFGLADASGVIVLGGDTFVEGAPASDRALKAGTPVTVDGKRIATVLKPDEALPWSSAEAQFVNRSRLALALAALTGIAAAGGIGIGLARGITRPLRTLQAAAGEVAKGEVASVSVKGDDEVADLARAFNHMSTELDHAQQARKQMTADIAHELRNPLTTISGYVQAIRDGDLDPSKDRLDAIYRQTMRLGRIIEDLRTLSLADVGSLSLAWSTVEARELVRSTAENYAVEAQQKGVTVSCLEEGELGELQGDPGRLTQVLGNLVSNAIRHTPAGGEVRIEARPEADAVVLKVEDTGEGIPPTDLPYIFDRFFRAGPPCKRDGKGSGLGLAIVKAIVSAHSGIVEAWSEPGVGTRFTIRLPRFQPALAAS